MRETTYDDYDNRGDDACESYRVTEGDIILPGSDRMEEILLAKHDVRTMLKRLPPVDRAVVALMQRYAAPPKYAGPWPSTPAAVRDYLRATFPKCRLNGFSVRSVAKIHRRALQQMSRWLGRAWRDHAS